MRGKIEGIDKEIYAQISVSGEKNYVPNWSFESGTIDPWIVEGDKMAVKVVKATPPQNAKTGVCDKLLVR